MAIASSAKIRCCPEKSNMKINQTKQTWHS